ncbi:cholinesterase-like [Saccostrea echinata]|uniref:cholinesterase-like n=1 Tax=Saccostrea echinata TaxID=191078 RepID=UPI002A817DD4|nr:cholinesterase-like [Saccostrea echinata]
MVWVHGGYFKFGSGSVYDGRILASKGGVIVVTINYRLGALGFLSTDDSVTSGNQALLDQSLALKWVNRNIHRFGGNPRQVTLFGESAGGASVSLHMFSPLSSGLFQGIISQSGCALSPFAVKRPPHSLYVSTRNLALKLGCPVLSSKIMVDCLRHKYAYEIVNIEAPDSRNVISFAPRVDGYFLHDVPEKILQRGDYNRNVKVLTGYVRDESSIFIPDDFDEQGGYNITQSKHNSSITIPDGSNWNTFGENKEYLLFKNSLELRKNPRNHTLAFWEHFNFLDFCANPDDPGNLV